MGRAVKRGNNKMGFADVMLVFEVIFNLLFFAFFILFLITLRKPKTILYYAVGFITSFFAFAGWVTKCINGKCGDMDLGGFNIWLNAGYCASVLLMTVLFFKDARRLFLIIVKTKLYQATFNTILKRIKIA